MRWVLRLLVTLVAVEAVRVAVVVADLWRTHRDAATWLEGWVEADMPEIPDAGGGVRVRPDGSVVGGRVDQVHAALELFEDRYAEAKRNPMIRFGPSGMPEFVGTADAPIAAPETGHTGYLADQLDVRRRRDRPQ